MVTKPKTAMEQIEDEFLKVFKSVKFNHSQITVSDGINTQSFCMDRFNLEQLAGNFNKENCEVLVETISINFKHIFKD